MFNAMKNIARACQAGLTPSLDRSLALEDATRKATLSTEKLSPAVIRDLHNAMDDLTIDPLTDSSD